MTVMLPELGSVHVAETDDELVLRVELPPEVDLSRMTARLLDGTLEITLPRVVQHPSHLPGFHPDASGV